MTWLAFRPAPHFPTPTPSHPYPTPFMIDI
jgi:hypothetical protein